MQCPACSTDLPDDDLFCENCGAALRPRSATPSPACNCGASSDEVDEDGFCLRCGRRLRRPPSDHIEESFTPAFAGVSDRGLRHERNEDRFALAQVDERYILVVCDGVSATPHAELASAAVAEGVRQFFVEAVRKEVSTDQVPPDQVSPDQVLPDQVLPDPAQIMREAIAAGAQQLTAHPEGNGADSPSTTVVAALVMDGQATIGWVGDSRAYWLDARGAFPLTTDHSWRNEVVAAAQMSAEDADRSPQAHAITRWIGADAGEAGEPEIVQHPISGPGLLLLCTDGLWNYAPTPQAMAELVEPGSPDGVDAREDGVDGSEDALSLALRLVGIALRRGGADNITAVVLQIQSP